MEEHTSSADEALDGSTSPEVGSLPAVEPRAPRAHPGKLSPEQGQAVARMYVNGASLGAIASALGRTPHGIRSALDTYLAPVVEQVRALVLRECAVHQFEMLGMLPQARAVIQGGLASADEPTRLNTARWLIEATVPKPVARSEAEIRLSGSVTHDVSGVLEQIGTHLAALRAANVGRNPLARVRSGLDALPRLPAPSSSEPEGDAA